MMNKGFIIAVLIIAAAVAFFYYAPNAAKVSDKTAALGERLKPVFLKFNLRETSLVGKYIEEKKVFFRRYIHAYKEYNVSDKFPLGSFESSLKENLKNSNFRIKKSAVSSAKGAESLFVDIASGRFDVLTLKINKRKEKLPPVTRKFSNPKVAIVVDDFGYSMNNVDSFLRISEALTLSILPNLRYSRKIAELARSGKKEIILHLPLESHLKSVKEENGTIKCGMPPGEISAMLESDIASVPGLRGVSNHMGSKATENKEVMSIILVKLKEKNLYYLDSVTSKKSVAKSLSASLGEKFAGRDIFLDNDTDMDYIRGQLLILRRVAFRTGEVIAVCHDRKNTAMALGEMLPELASEGIRFVHLSELVK